MRVSLQPAYIIHRRPYRNTSALLDVLTEEYGLIGLVAKGVRKQNSEKNALLEPFSRLLLSFSGRGELMNLTTVEPAGPRVVLAGGLLYSGIYVNELIQRLLHRHDPHEKIFTGYSGAIQALAQTDCQPEPILRKFELRLLAQLGYGLQLQHEAMLQDEISPDRLYRYDLGSGPVSVNGRGGIAPVVSGRCLLAMAQEEFTNTELLGEMKLLMRQVISHYMGGRDLKSRELFKKIGV